MVNPFPTQVPKTGCWSHAWASVRLGGVIMRQASSYKATPEHAPVVVGHAPSFRWTRAVLATAAVCLICLASCWSDAEWRRQNSPWRQVQTPGPYAVHDIRPLMLEERLPFIELDQFTAIRTAGPPTRLEDLASGMPLLVVVRSAHSELGELNGPELAQIEQEYLDQVGFAFLALDEEGARQFLLQDREHHGFRGPGLHDSNGVFANTFELRSRDEVFLFDRARTLKYRGAVDNKPWNGQAQRAPKQQFLREAIRYLLKDERPKVQATSIAYQKLNYTKQKGVESPVLTYHNRVSRILANNCVGCHRTGGTGPFTLDNYAAIRKRSKMIAWALEQGVMPPWFAAPPENPSAPRPWANLHQITPGDKQALLSWLDSSMEQGDPAQAPVPEHFPKDWQIGTPDLIARIPEPFNVPAEGIVDYRYAFVKLDTDRDQWIDKIQIRPSAAQNVHHIVVLLQEPTSSHITEREKVQGFQQRNYFASMTPNQEITEFPLGTAKLLPAGSWLKFQIHYVTNGISVEDQTEIGFHFSAEPPLHELQTLSAANAIFRIPPRTPDYKMRAQFRFREDCTLYSFNPHMHLRGKSFTYEMLYPDGHTDLLLDIPNYDFNWQLRYILSRPLQIPAGSILQASAHFDNSSGNPSNPDPSQYVRFGPQSHDEMMIGYFEVTTRASQLR